MALRAFGRARIVLWGHCTQESTVNQTGAGMSASSFVVLLISLARLSNQAGSLRQWLFPDANTESSPPPHTPSHSPWHPAAPELGLGSQRHTCTPQALSCLSLGPPRYLPGCDKTWIPRLSRMMVVSRDCADISASAVLLQRVSRPALLLSSLNQIHP
jgi:hypothetical protein